MTNSSASGKGVVENTTPKSCLIPGKIVKVRPVPVRKTPFIVGTDRDRIKSEQIMLTGTSRSIICPKYDNGRFVEPLTWEEREYLEKALGVNLDINKPNDNYLNEVRIQVSKNSDDIGDVFTELDLGTPDGFLAWRVCLVAPEVASEKNPEGHYKAEHWFYLDDDEVQETSDRDGNKVEDDCLKFLYTIEDNKEKLYNFLRTFNLIFKTNKRIDKQSASSDWIYNEIKGLIKSRESRTRVHQLVEMVKKDLASYELKLVIQDALSIGEIKYNSSLNEYTNSVNEVIGKSLKDVEDFLRNPANQIKREHIKAQIKLQLK